MKTTAIKYLAIFAMIATALGFTCSAGEPKSKLQLHGKTLMVYPVLMGREGIPDNEGTLKFGVLSDARNDEAG